MSNLIVRNTTSSSITVSGFTVYNIRSENSTFIVYVEETSNTAPSVGDIITFGNYPQATSTPEPIEWIVLAVDSVNRKALLIAQKVLDWQDYNNVETSITWETCSLRTWLNGTFFTAAFDSTEQACILLSHIENPNNPTYGTSGGNATDDYLFPLSISEATSLFANDNARKADKTSYATSHGANQSRYWLRSPGRYAWESTDVNQNGVLYEEASFAYKSGIRPALWMDYSQTVICKSFKYTSNGISYYYVIDGIHNFWTDDLSSIGYSEISPAPALPTVTIEFYDAWGSWLNAGNNNSAKQTINSGSISTTWFYRKDGSQYAAYYTFEELYDSSKSYAIMRWNSDYGVFGGYYGFSIVSENGYYGMKNITSSSLSVNSVRVAVCSDSTATVVTVYNSSNVAYNAFKFTLSGTDYYYVLDGTQTDWTDDLSSIGYRSLDTFEMIFGLKYDTVYHEWLAVNVSNDYWWAGVLNADDYAVLNALGLIYTNTQYPYKELKYDSRWSYEIVALYSDFGETEIPINTSDFDARRYTGYDAIAIYCTGTYSINAKSWKCRITRIS